VESLTRLETVGEAGDHPAGQRDVPGLHGHPRGGGVGLDDRQEGVRRQQGRFVRVRVDDLRVRHRGSVSRLSGRFLDVKIYHPGFPGATATSPPNEMRLVNAVRGWWVDAIAVPPVRSLMST